MRVAEVLLIGDFELKRSRVWPMVRYVPGVEEVSDGNVNLTKSCRAGRSMFHFR